RPLLADRPRDPDRAREQELDPDRRVRQAAPRGGPVAARRRARGRRGALPAGGDDGAGIHPGRRAADAGQRRRRGGAPLARHRRLRRHAGGDGAESGADSRALRDRAGRGRVAGPPPARTGRAGRSDAMRFAMGSARGRVAAMLLAGALLACGRGEAPPGPPPPEVRVATAVLGAIPDHREYVGNVRAVNRVEVRARVRGYLRAQRFEDGQRVAEGDVLFEIDPSTYEAALAE